MSGPLRPCNTCGKLYPAGQCPAHPPTSRQYRPRRPSVIEYTYDAEYRALRLEILEADSHTCVYCNAPATTTDHIHPASRGGPSTSDNLAAACQPCNNSKKDLTPLEWLASGRAPANARARIWGNSRFTREATP